MPKNRIIKVQNIPITIAEADMDDYDLDRKRVVIL